MQVAITCRHGEISGDFRDYMSRKSEKLLHYFERVQSAQVTLDFEGDRVRVEMLVDAEHKHDFVTHHEMSADDVGPCFDQVLAKMEQQIRKYKEKLTDHRRDKPLSKVIGDGLDSDVEESENPE
ncbi:ribosome hibernation-promoting factor, HPF/YfiA family [Thalassoglobus polymorphus]|uniref:Ribosome hibernation promoting factor n=1 Tax=Thalassoglobus polymorphus TaxID=2527994 RepID=A0A517QQZ4_9PLAN|nr:ribosome-associated translation inhibitor RaiA [Thalassoglobus polymorphus]QDT34050.1 Ribosome hibernation promoting factor [Thalassoglobus polymorphus]